MKLHCVCDQVIRDQTDALPFKALLVADQDLDDFSEAAKGVVDDPIGRWVALSRAMYQCPRCGRLHVEDTAGVFRSFLPEDPATSKGLLASSLGDQRPRWLRASWCDPNPAGYFPSYGTLTTGDEDDAGMGNLNEGERFYDFDALSERYFYLFGTLRDRGVLRGAAFLKNGERLHSWPSGSRASEA